MNAGAAARRSAILPACAALLFAVYGLPLLWPPAAAPLASPEPGASLLARLFPGVPAWWIAVRLVSLAAAAALAAVATAARDIPWVRPSEAAAPRPAANGLNAALAVACLLVVIAAGAATLGRPGQTLFLPAMLLPALIVGLSERTRSVRSRSGSDLAFLVILLCVWVILRMPAALGSPRCADPIDMWTNFAWLLDAVADGRNLLTSSSQPGLSDAWMLLQGASLWPAGRPGFEWFQAVHFVWLVLTAAAVWDAVRLMLGGAAAAAATAVLLFSPFFGSLPYNAAPFGVMTFLAAAMLVLLARVYAHRSAAAATALGPTVGLAATLPHLIPLAAFVAVTGLWIALRPPRLAARTTLTALLLGFAVVLPALPDAATLESMMTTYVARNSEWQGLEAALLGQRSIDDVRQLYDGGTGELVDVPLGAALAPFAIPRTPLRLWGDSLFDPIGGALVALGVGACLWRLRRDRTAAFALVLMVISISPGLVSGYNRTSLHRMVAGPLVWAMMAAIGYALVWQDSRRRLPAMLVAGAVAVGGTLLFDVVNPRIVPTSWMAIALEANEDAAFAGEAAFLEYGRPERLPWLHVDTIGRHLAEPPIESHVLVQAGDLDKAAAGAKVLYWSPALEEDHRVSEAVCGRWPGASLVVLSDAAGISRAWAAHLEGGVGEPCGSGLSSRSDVPDVSDLSGVEGSR